MVIANLAAFFKLFQHIDYGRRFLDFTYPDRNDTRPETMNELFLAWLGYMSRYLDMFDTFFFCLRKKQNQISFLHGMHWRLYCYMQSPGPKLIFNFNNSVPPYDRAISRYAPSQTDQI